MEELRARQFCPQKELIIPVHQSAECLEVYRTNLSSLFSAATYRHVKQHDGAQRKRNNDHSNHRLISSVTAWFHCSSWARLGTSAWLVTRSGNSKYPSHTSRLMLNANMRTTPNACSAAGPMWFRSVTAACWTAGKSPSPSVMPKADCRQCNPKALENRNKNINSPNSTMRVASSATSMPAMNWLCSPVDWAPITMIPRPSSKTIAVRQTTF